MHWPLQTGRLPWSVEELSCRCRSSSLSGRSLDHVFCPSWEKMLTARAVALSTKRKAELFGEEGSRVRQGRRSAYLSLSAFQEVARTSMGERDATLLS